MRLIENDAPDLAAVRAALQKSRAGCELIPRSYKLITPLWGGGAVANQVDEAMPINGKGIRGHLRFWWRATRGARYENLKDLKKAEDALWGAAGSDDKEKNKQLQYRVQLDVGILDSGSNEALPAIPEYIAFPLNPKDEELEGFRGEEKKEERRRLRKVNNKRSLRSGVRFHFTLRLPLVGNKEKDEERRADVEAALWAWETFGGYGARTRRGFGALEQIDSTDRPREATPEAMREWLLGDDEKPGKLRTHVIAGAWSGKMQNVPHLERNLGQDKQWKVITASNGLKAWAELIGALRDFRQGFRPTKTVTITKPGKAPYNQIEIGQTDWPDADSVRIATGDYDDTIHPPRIMHGHFPRAAFGLPIIFHFKDRKGDPQDTSLQGANYERLNSRLILRPLACQKGYVGLALILAAPDEPLGGLQLKSTSSAYTWRAGGNSTKVKQHLTPAEASQAPTAKRKAPLKGNPDVLQAFLDTLK